MVEESEVSEQVPSRTFQIIRVLYEDRNTNAYAVFDTREEYIYESLTVKDRYKRQTTLAIKPSSYSQNNHLTLFTISYFKHC